MEAIRTIALTPAQPPVPAKKRVAAYARISEVKGNTPQSLSAQVSYYNAFITTNPEWEFAGIFVDEGITGTSIKRPGFQDLLAQCEEGQIDLILTKSISRFSRNTVDLLASVRHLKALGVEVRFERENISTFSGDRELMLSILASFAQEESWSTSANVKWGIRKGFERGITNQMCVYGYTWTGSEFIINEHQAEAVRYTYKRFLEDATYADIIRECIDLGYEAYWGGPFTSAAIKMILRQRRYTGNAILGQWYNPYPGHHGARNTGQAPTYYVEGINPIIIDQETWDKVQPLLEARTKANNRQPHGVTITVFHNKVSCGPCQCNANRATHFKTVDGTLIKCWKCPRRNKKRTYKCEGGGLPEARIMQATCLLTGVDEFSDELFTEHIKQVTLLRRGWFSIETTDGRIFKIHYSRGKAAKPLTLEDFTEVMR